MPLWKIYHSPGVYTAEDKRGLAQAITGVYGRVMPMSCDVFSLITFLA